MTDNETIAITHLFDEETKQPIPYNLKERLIYAEAEKKDVPAAPNAPKNQTPLSYFRINLATKHPDGTMGPVILESDECYSYGVSENRNRQTNALDGWSMGVAMWNREGPTPRQKATTDFLEDFVEDNKQHIVAVRDSIEQYQLERPMLWKYKAQYWKMEKGVRVPNKGPTCYPKLIASKKDGLRPITRIFHKDYKDAEGKPIELDPLALIGVHGIVSMLFVLESIFIGANGTIISLQIKLREADFRPVESGIPRLRPVSSTAVILDGDSNPILALMKSRPRKEEDSKEQKANGAPPQITTGIDAGVQQMVIADPQMGSSPPATNGAPGPRRVIVRTAQPVQPPQ